MWDGRDVLWGRGNALRVCTLRQICGNCSKLFESLRNILLSVPSQYVNSIADASYNKSHIETVQQGSCML